MVFLTHYLMCLMVMAQAALLVLFAMFEIVSIYSSCDWFSGGGSGGIEVCSFVYLE